MLTVAEVQASVPANLKRSVTQSLVDAINQSATDPLVAEQIRSNFVSYTGVLRDGRYRTEDYLTAVTYVSYKLMGDTNREAWAKTFPDRFNLLVSRGASEKEIASHVSAYNKGKLVNAILEQSLIPPWVLNQDMFQRALNVQADLMLNANSEKVRSDAANSILTHLKKPEGKIEVDLNIKDSSGINELRTVLADLAVTQKRLIEDGAGIGRVTDGRIIDNETGQEV